ncbi:ABC transporter substrate-binding protein [Glutamicibacter sp. X7]
MIAKRFRRAQTLVATVMAAAIALTGCAISATNSAPPTESNESGYTVKHAMGETKLPATPQRIVVIDSPHLDALTALGITPIGATESGANAGFPEYLDLPQDAVTSVGLTAEPSVDKIAELGPDLIIGAKVRHEAIYEELSAIAPTVFSENSGTDWQEQARVTAAAVNQSEQMETLLSDLEQRATDVGKQIGAKGTTASMVRFRPDNFRLYGPQSFSGSLLTQVGFDLGNEGWNEYSMKELSPEHYAQIDGDVVFYANPGGDPKATTMHKVSALWSDLNSVAQDKAYEVADETWMVGIGVKGAHKILDQLQELMG